MIKIKVRIVIPLSVIIFSLNNDQLGIIYIIIYNNLCICIELRESFALCFIYLIQALLFRKIWKKLRYYAYAYVIMKK